MSELSIHQAMAAVLKDLPAIGKNQRNQQQGYQFRGIDDVIDALNPLLAKHGVFFVPDVIERIESARQTRNGGTMWVVNLHVRYRFYGPAGDSVEATAWGEGTDSGDKATQKAMTGAMKYVLFQVFAIATHEQAEADSDRTTPAPSARRSTKSAEAGSEQTLGRVSGPEPVSARMSAGAEDQGKSRTEASPVPSAAPAVPVPPSGATAVAVQAPTPAQESELSTDNEWHPPAIELHDALALSRSLIARKVSVFDMRKRDGLPKLDENCDEGNFRLWQRLLADLDTANPVKANA